MFLAFSAILNIFLDLFCIVVLKWDCAGAAIATITAQAVSGILCLVYIFKKVQIMHLEAEDREIEGSAVKELLVMGIPTGLQFSITAIGSMVMQSANNKLGSVYVSGFTAGMRIKQFTMCPFDAFATAASVFCDQNLGAGQAKRIKQGLWQAIAVAVGYGIVAGLVMIIFGRPLSMIFVKKSAVDVLDASAKYLRCMGFFLLESRYIERGAYGDTGTWIFRSGYIFRCYRDGGQDHSEPGICRNIWIHGHLLC